MSVSNLFIEVTYKKKVKGSLPDLVNQGFVILSKENEIISKEDIFMANRFLEVLSDVITAMAEAAAEEQGRSIAMDLINRNTTFLDQYAKDIVRDLAGMNTTSYYARRQIEALHLSDKEKDYLKRRIILEGSSVDYYAKSQIDHLLRTI